MSGLLTAAIVASLLGILVCGGFVAQIAQKRDYLLLFVLFLLALPLSAGTYYLVRLPIKGFAAQHGGETVLRPTH